MKHILTFLTIFLTISTLSCAGKKYHSYEGPLRLTLIAPRIVNTNQRFLLKGKLCGEQARVPLGELILVEIKAKRLLIAKRSYILESRFISAPVVLTPAFYRTFMSTRLRSPLDHIETSVGVLEPIEGVEERPLSLDVNLEMFIYIAEINYKGKVVAVDLVSKAHRRTKLHCIDRNCQTIY